MDDISKEMKTEEAQAYADSLFRGRRQLDWKGLSFKDQEVVLQEDARKVTCEEGLLKLRDQLKTQIKDEFEASQMYERYAAKFYTMNFLGFESALKSLSDDERNHRMILETVVDYITEKCG